jgi:hypothetical protein
LFLPRMKLPPLAPKAAEAAPMTSVSRIARPTAVDVALPSHINFRIARLSTNSPLASECALAHTVARWIVSRELGRVHLDVVKNPASCEPMTA